MNIDSISTLTNRLIETVKTFDISLAGIAPIDQLKNTPSWETTGEKAGFPQGAKSALVLGLTREGDLDDWWHLGPNGKNGHRHFVEITEQLKPVIETTFGISAYIIPYHVSGGGVYLKDAAVLAGLGVIGKNNLLVTPHFGPRVRLRAMLLGRELAPTGPIDFNPCQECSMPCRRVCPSKAFSTGSYVRQPCFDHNVMLRERRPMTEIANPPKWLGEHCRICELACPVGK